MSSVTKSRSAVKKRKKKEKQAKEQERLARKLQKELIKIQKAEHSKKIKQLKQVKKEQDKEWRRNIDEMCAAAISGTGEILEDCSASGRKRPWAKMKKQNEQIFELIQTAQDKELYAFTKSFVERFKSCGNLLVFGEFDISSNEKRRKLIRANFCKARLCAMCNWRKSLKTYNQVSRIIDEINKKSDNKVRYLFLTLTVKNVKGEFLSDTITAMDNGFKDLVQQNRGYSAGKKLQKNLLGYFKAFETTYNPKKDDFHPHFHVLLAVKSSYFKGGNYLSHEEFQAAWQNVMKLDYKPQVNIKSVKWDKIKIESVKEYDGVSAKAKTIAEIAKYATKVSDVIAMIDKDKAAEVVVVLHKAMVDRRLITYGGIFRDIKAELGLSDVEKDLVHTDKDEDIVKEKPIAMYLYRWVGRIGAYIC